MNFMKKTFVRLELKKPTRHISVLKTERFATRNETVSIDVRESYCKVPVVKMDVKDTWTQRH